MTELKVGDKVKSGRSVGVVKDVSPAVTFEWGIEGTKYNTLVSTKDDRIKSVVRLDESGEKRWNLKVGDVVRGKHSGVRGVVREVYDSGVRVDFDNGVNSDGMYHPELHLIKVEPKKAIVQDWVIALPCLRFQGVLVSAVRGCDSVGKEDPTKALVRCLRAVILNANCGDPAKAKSFIENVDDGELRTRMTNVVRNYGHLPIHYVMHLVHAAQIIGYYHPDETMRLNWKLNFYETMVRKLHLHVESKEELEKRLGADEDTFGASQ